MGYNTESGYFDHKKLAELGDGTGNSAVVACLNVLATAFAEPSLLISSRNSEGDYTRDMNHPLAKLIRRPNPYMTQQLLANYIVTSLNANGDAFIYKNRNARGQVVELVPLMPHLVEAKGNENELITHFTNINLKVVFKVKKQLRFQKPIWFICVKMLTQTT